MSCTKPCVYDYSWWYRNQLLTVVTPFIFLPIPLFIPTQAAWCGWVVCVMSVYWCTMCVPMYITGIMPMFVFPLMGILPASEIALEYMGDSMLVFTGAVTSAFAVERVNLHYRIALGVLDKISFRSQWLMIGLCLPTWFLSMWVMNTAVLAMMLVIMVSLLDKMQEVIEQLNLQVENVSIDIEEEDTAVEMTYINSDSEVGQATPIDEDEKPRYTQPGSQHAEELDPSPGKNNIHITTDEENRPKLIKKLGISFSLGVGYAAKIGGLAALTGSSNNLVAIDYINDYYAAKGLPSPVNYTNWMALCMPLSCLCIIGSQIWLQFQYEGCISFATCFKKMKMTPVQREAKLMIKKQYESLGRISYEEVLVIILFSLLVVLWFFRDPGFVPGWGQLFPQGYVTDTAPAVLIAFLMFFIPLKPLWRKAIPGTSKTETLLNWKFVNERFPWGVFFMVGGGAAVGSASQKSGLNDWIASILGWLEEIPIVLLILFVFFMLSLFTEVLAVSTINGIFSWILGDIAVSMGYSPLTLMLPCAISASLSFMLPSCGSDSAMVFECNRLPVMHMVKAGFAVKCICCPLATLAMCTWGVAIFDLGTIPWDTSENATTSQVIRNGYLQGIDTVSLFEW